jgi:DinB superfamily
MNIDAAVLESLASAPDRLEKVMLELEKTGKLNHPREDGKWTPMQILSHLADLESLFMIRLYQHLLFDKPNLMMLPQDQLVQVTHAPSRDIRLALNAYRAQRLRNLEFVKTLVPEELKRLSLHPVRGDRTLGEWIGILAWHDGNHIKQLEASL